MDLRRYWAVIRRRRWLIAAVVAVALAVLWQTGGLRTPSPRYRATATLALTTLPGQPSSFPVEAIRTLAVAREAIELAAVDAEPAAALDSVSVRPRGGTPIVDIQVERGDPKEAAALANGFAAAYLRRAALARSAGPQPLQVLREAHDRLGTEAKRTKESGADPIEQEWELRWIRTLDDLVARAYSEVWLRELLSEQAPEQSVQKLETSSGVQVLGTRIGADAYLLELASPPPRPVENPGLQQARVLGGIGGVALLAALTLAFLLEYVDDRVRTESDIEEATGLPVLATLPSRRQMRRATRRFVAAGKRLSGFRGEVSPEPSPIPDPRLAESFQSLRVQIDLAGAERPLRVLLVASPRNGGDKSVVAAYLATVFAQSGRRVVAVSADLHRAGLESFFAIDETPGLGEVAAGRAEPTACVKRSWIPNLAVVPAGVAEAHPADVLASKGVAEVFEVLRSAAELVIIEAPPVLAGAEASILVPYSDAVLLVVEAAETTREQALTAKSSLEKVKNGAVFLGAVMTNVQDGRDVRRNNGRRSRTRPRRPRGRR